MRLKQIKLSGFKSFVDPTAFQIPSQLVGVVGPNGCGKSNVIDAVRWVLGESKASELRGESMQDVIFSGSSERKPAARASVELVFDNSLGRIGGNWANYTEISVRRTLSRDGQSIYQINNQAVRRRDVHDMFMGTGLGPRAYAIIGQGTISRIIEAKPDELRVFLEEAAGVSKYKERRRETESRLASTRENLNRVEDIQRELGAQIQRLNHQAEVAASFKQMDDERTVKQRVQWIVRRDEALRGQADAATQAGRAQTALEAKIAELRQTEARCEVLREQFREVGNELHEAQGAFYESNAAVTRLESDIRRIVDTRSELTSRQASLAAEIERLGNTADNAQREHEQAEAALHALGGSLEQLQQALATERERAAHAEAVIHEARHRFDGLRDASADSRRALDVCRAEIRALSERSARVASRIERAHQQEAEIEDFDAGSLDEALAAVVSSVALESAAATALVDARSSWADLDSQRVPAQQALRDAEARQAQIDARMAALEDIQNRLDRQNDMSTWLATNGLGDLQPLWQRLRIQDGWETAVEAVLRERVTAVQTDDLARGLALAADAPPPVKLMLFDDSVPGVTAPPVAGLKPLATMVRSGEAAVQDQVERWLAGCFVAESLTEAWARRSALPPGGEFIVRDGHRVGACTLHLFAVDSEAEGVLQRQHELENLAREKRAQTLLVEQARQHANNVEAGSAARSQALEEARIEQVRLAQVLAAAQITAQRYEQQADSVRQDRERVSLELAECARLQAELGQSDEQARLRISELEARVAEFDDQIPQHREAVQDAERDMQAVREQLRAHENAEQAARYEERSLRERLERLTTTIDDAATRRSQLQAESAALQERLTGFDTSALEEALQVALETRGDREQALAAVRSRQDDIAAELKKADENRLSFERAREPLANQVTEAQLKEQAARLAVVQFQEQLDQADVAAQAEAALLAGFDERPRATWLASEVTRLTRAIEQLGPVNLAALDELREASERKGFLDSQSADLNEAIATLEDAIRHIDLETRQLLQTTFDTVNAEFGKLFPELFGGGDAKLVLTGEEILDAGVQVMAHPPGKRNTSIHLLSGGEKALTAIALVFGLFQLNPAPFCLLDEVDAPLDDANTERYRNMVMRMSAQTQFLFISHNKIAMEMAQQLIGVTMQERGVSRIVAVDLESAAEFAEAA